VTFEKVTFFDLTSMVMVIVTVLMEFCDVTAGIVTLDGIDEIVSPLQDQSEGVTVGTQFGCDEWDCMHW
jgi:hypothetical protein